MQGFAAAADDPKRFARLVAKATVPQIGHGYATVLLAEFASAILDHETEDDPKRIEESTKAIMKAVADGFRRS